jgi:zinc D-Ala-D-Ala dipeptidase
MTFNFKRILFLTSVPKVLGCTIFCLFLLTCYGQKTDNTVKVDYDTKKWTEVTSLDNTIKTDMRYATTNNFTKAKMYDCARCFLRPEAAKAVAKAHKVLKTKGYGGLKMFDCYRPRPYQQRLWDKVPDPHYVMPPWKGSEHSRGLAVDLTIVDKNGKELDMGTEFDNFTVRAHTDNLNLPKEVLENRQILRGVLQAVGFKGIRTEWWHFSYQKKKQELSSWVWLCR